MSEPAGVETRTSDEPAALAEPPALPEGVLAVRVGPGANCSSAGSTIDILFYGSAIVGAIAVALAAAFPPRAPRDDDEGGDGDGGGGGRQPATGGGAST